MRSARLEIHEVLRSSRAAAHTADRVTMDRSGCLAATVAAADVAAIVVAIVAAAKVEWAVQASRVDHSSCGSVC